MVDPTLAVLWLALCVSAAIPDRSLRCVLMIATAAIMLGYRISA